MWSRGLFKCRDGTSSNTVLYNPGPGFFHSGWRTAETTDVFTIKAEPDPYSLQPNGQIKTLISNYKYKMGTKQCVQRR